MLPVRFRTPLHGWRYYAGRKRSRASTALRSVSTGLRRRNAHRSSEQGRWKVKTNASQAFGTGGRPPRCWLGDKPRQRTGTHRYHPQVGSPSTPSPGRVGTMPAAIFDSSCRANNSFGRGASLTISTRFYVQFGQNNGGASAWRSNSKVSFAVLSWGGLAPQLAGFH